MTAGRGFMALAAMIFGQWHPVKALWACLLFGALDAIAIRLQGVSLPMVGEVPVQAVQALPYQLTVVLLAGSIGKSITRSGDLGAEVPGVLLSTTSVSFLLGKMLPPRAARTLSPTDLGSLLGLASMSALVEGDAFSAGAGASFLSLAHTTPHSIAARASAATGRRGRVWRR